MARNMQKSNEMDDGGESSEEDGGADVVVNKEGIPLPRTVRGRITRKGEGFARKPEINEVGVDPLVSVVSTGTDEEDEDEEDEEDEDEEVSSDNGSDAHLQNIIRTKEQERHLQMEAEKVIRQQRLARQLLVSGSEDQTLVEVHEVEDEEEEEDEDDEEDEEEDMEDAKEVLPTKVNKMSIYFEILYLLLLALNFKACITWGK